MYLVIGFIFNLTTSVAMPTAFGTYTRYYPEIPNDVTRLLQTREDTAFVSEKSVGPLAMGLTFSGVVPVVALIAYLVVRL